MSMKDFVMIPRAIKYALVDGYLTLNEFIILLWIFINTNPFNGRFEASYIELVQVFKGKISYQNMRKIISSLRSHNQIWFQDHRGRGGKFTIYPLNYQRTDEHIQTIDDFTVTTFQLTQKTSDTVVVSQLSNKSKEIDHNFKDIFDTILVGKELNKKDLDFTTAYNDTENKNHNLKIDRKNKPVKEISMEEFNPNNGVHYRCLEIAKEFEEKNINYLLSVANKHGIQVIENARGLYYEQFRTKKANNPAAYLNKLIQLVIEKTKDKTNL